MNWTVEVKEDKDGELYIDLPEELLDHFGWGEGTTIQWIDNKNGTFSIVEAEKPMYVVYSKPNCPNCDRAKMLLDINACIYEVKEVTDPEIRNQLLDLVPSARSVPQIFKDGEHIGGYEELSKQLGEQNAIDGES